MDIIIKLWLITIVFVLIIIILQLYAVIRHGKLIISAKKSRFSAIGWIVWVLMIIALCIVGYINYRNNNFTNILENIIWIEISIFNIISILESSGIKKNGINYSGNFYKWSKIQSYSWILPTTIQFKVNTFFIANYNFEFTIKKELKFKANETVQKYVL